MNSFVRAFKSRKTWSIFISFASVIALGGSSFLSAPVVKAAPAEMMRITEVPATEPNGDTDHPVMTSDGRFVTFSSVATTMVAGDENNVRDVFIYDHNDDSIELVSVSSSEEQGNAASADNDDYSGLSANGNFVIFSSYASNLVAGDNNDASDIFVRNRAAGTTERVNVSTAGDEAQQYSANRFPVISNDGKYAAFVSDADNLVVGDTNESNDIFVRSWDDVTPSTTRVSLDYNGDELPGGVSVESMAMSGDGQYLVYATSTSGITDDVNPGSRQIYRYNIGSGVTELVSFSTTPLTGGDGDSYGVSVSDDGNRIAFISEAPDLISGDSNNKPDVFVADIDSEGAITISRASVTSAGAEHNDSYDIPSAFISGNGQYVSFVSESDTLGGEVDGDQDVFIHTNGPGGATVRVSLKSDNGDVNDFYGFNSITKPSDTGGSIAFISRTDEILGDTVDTNNKRDLFYHTYNSSGPVHTNYRVWNSDPDFSPVQGGNNNTLQAHMSDDGRYVVFATEADNLLPVTDGNGTYDIYWYDTQEDDLRLVSATNSSNTAAGNGESTEPSVSNDGRYVVFQSSATDLISNPEDSSTTDIYMRDIQTNTTVRITETASAEQANGDSQFPMVSGNGQYIVFTSGATDLTTGDTNERDDIYLYDIGADSYEIISVSTAGVQAGESSYRPDVSDDGNYVLFSSWANNWIPEGEGFWSGHSAYIRDRGAGTTTLVSMNESGNPREVVNDYRMSLSANGQYAVFGTSDSLITADNNPYSDIYRVDWQQGTSGIELVSSDEDDNAVGDESNHGYISANGNYVVFDSVSDDLVPGDNNGKADIFIKNMTTGAIERASITPDEEEGVLDSVNPVVSSDGNKVAFIKKKPGGSSTFFRGALFGEFTDPNPSYNDLYYVSFGESTASAPTVTSSAATDITQTTATLNGNITDAGSPAPETRGFEYGLDATYGDMTSESGSYAAGAFSLPVTGLTCETTYHFRAYASNTEGTGNGSDLTFTTTACDGTPPGSGTTTGSQAGTSVDGGYVTAHPNGTLILDGSTVYLIKDRQRFGFRDPEEYRSYGYNFDQVVLANLFDRSRLPVSEDVIKAMPGSLVLDKTDGRTVYMIGPNNTKRGFASEPIFNQLGFNYTKLFSIDLSDYQTGAVINSADQVHPEGSLVRENDLTVWWILNGQRSGFESEQVLNTYGFTPSRLVKVNDKDMSLSVGPLVKLRDGTLVQDDGFYFIISDGQKMQFASTRHLELWGYKLSNVINADIDRYEVGTFPR